MQSVSAMSAESKVKCSILFLLLYSLLLVKCENTDIENKKVAEAVDKLVKQSVAPPSSNEGKPKGALKSLSPAPPITEDEVDVDKLAKQSVAPPSSNEGKPKGALKSLSPAPPITEDKVDVVEASLKPGANAAVENKEAPSDNRTCKNTDIEDENVAEAVDKLAKQSVAPTSSNEGKPKGALKSFSPAPPITEDKVDVVDASLKPGENAAVENKEAPSNNRTAAMAGGISGGLFCVLLVILTYVFLYIKAGRKPKRRDETLELTQSEKLLKVRRNKSWMKDDIP